MKHALPGTTAVASVPVRRTAARKGCKRFTLTSSADWLSYFERNARSLRPIPWELGVTLTAAERAAAVSSVPTFQIGETGSGRRLLEAAGRYVEASGDDDYLAALRLFIAEEQRHGGDLGRWLDLAGIPRISRLPCI